MAATIDDVKTGVSTLEATTTALDTDIKALIAKGNIDLDPVVAALAALNTALVALDDAIKAALNPPPPVP